MDEIEALHLACAFDLKVPERRRAEVLALIALINEQLWVGHFDLWTKDGMVMFRHALVLAGGVEVAGRQCEALLDAALDACERYFQAFQFVVWAGKPRARGARRRDVRDRRARRSRSCRSTQPARLVMPMRLRRASQFAARRA